MSQESPSRDGAAGGVTCLLAIGDRFAPLPTFIQALLIVSLLLSAIAHVRGEEVPGFGRFEASFSDAGICTNPQSGLLAATKEAT
jgi:hypothetical protein